MPKPGFLHELRRHHIFRVAATYAVVAWLLIQVITVIFPLLGFPDWLARTLVVMSLAGFPVALVLAWVFHVPQDEGRVAGKAWRRSLRFGIGLGGCGVLVALAAGWVWWYFGPVQHTLRADGQPTSPVQATSAASVPAAATTTAPAINPNSIAVLPFSVRGDGTQETYLGQGISEELINALSRVPGLEVIGRTSSFRFGGSDIDAGRIGRELDVRNLLVGSVQRSGDALRINVELDDTVTGYTLWTEQYQEKMQGLFELEDKISDRVVGALKVKLGGAQGESLVFDGTAVPQAHDLYLQGSRLSWHTDEASLEQALGLFNRAVAIDPNYGAAWAGVARTYVYLADVYRAPLEVLPAMRGAAEKAATLNPQLAEAHLLLGYIAMSYDLDYPRAKRELDLAVKLRPSLAEAHAMLGLYQLRVARDPVAARRELQEAGKLDPLNAWFPRWEATAAIVQANESDAMKLARRVDTLDPNFAYDGDAVAMVDGAFGHWQACVDRYKKQHAALSLSSPQLAVCQAHVGDKDQARATIAALESAAQQRYVDRSYIAAIYAALGDKGKAVANLEQAWKDRSAHSYRFRMDPWYRPLHGDPRFDALVARIASGDHVGRGSSASIR